MFALAERNAMADRWRALACDMLYVQLVTADIIGSRDCIWWRTTFGEMATPQTLQDERVTLEAYLESAELRGLCDMLDVPVAAYMNRAREGLAGQHRRKAYKRTSRHYGVSYQPMQDRWLARVYYDGQGHYVGCYKTEDEAAQAVNDYIMRHGLSRPLNVIE